MGRVTPQRKWRTSKAGKEWIRAWRKRNRPKLRIEAAAYYKKIIADPVKKKKLRDRYNKWAKKNKVRILGYRYADAPPTRPKPTKCELKCGRKATARDHKPGLFRGWLCHQCNAALGFFKDDPALIVRASKYLRKHSK